MKEPWERGHLARLPSGHIEDLQARLNVNNLLANGQFDEASVPTWTRLFEPRFLTVEHASGLLAARLGRRDDTAGLLTIGGTTPPGASPVAQSQCVALSPTG